MIQIYTLNNPSETDIPLNNQMKPNQSWERQTFWSRETLIWKKFVFAKSKRKNQNKKRLTFLFESTCDDNGNLRQSVCN